MQYLFEKIEQVQQNLDRHAEVIKKGCERDIRLVDNRLRVIEKKMWTIAGALTIISFVVSPVGQRFVRVIDSTTSIEYNTNKIVISIWI